MYIIIHIYIYYVNVKCKYRQAAKICQAPSHPLVPSTSIPLVAHEVRCSRPGRFDVFVQVPKNVLYIHWNLKSDAER